MRAECPDCMVYRSIPDHKGDCGEHCLLELDWDQVEKDYIKYEKRSIQKMKDEGTWTDEMEKSYNG